MDSRLPSSFGSTRRKETWLGLALSLFCLLPPVASAEGLPPAATRRIDFKADVEPLFRQCYACHGPAQQLGGLRLDRKREALRGGNSGPSIIPGKSAESRLVQMVAGYEVKFVMPPAGERLSADEIGILRAWIDQGAEWPERVQKPAKILNSVKPRHSTH